ncbi:hypothetical protein [Streptomyces tirandamycinicus]|uniref:Uncharacterized protein n=1 Tax=Streptomyces tirandamycinicus TaxID=2174846 RepID=A0A2S1T2D4_9ACTN|nr:hypothetical protein [Streptomyces tirandamycinicus]AWI32677.1 hypothetical protein DDW44_30645 [Streptomyces tirandamycinicus]
MAAPQQDAPDGRGSRQSRWTEPDLVAVTEQIKALSALTNREFAAELAAFIATDNDDRDQVVAYAIRSPELVRKARRLIPDIVREPEKYLPAVPGESNNAHRRRLAQVRARAEHEAEILFRVQAGMVARRGHLMPEPSPRSRARRRLADEYPERFLELVRAEEEADRARAAERTAERKRQRDAAGQ